MCVSMETLKQIRRQKTDRTPVLFLHHPSALQVRVKNLCTQSGMLGVRSPDPNGIVYSIISVAWSHQNQQKQTFPSCELSRDTNVSD